MGYQWVLWRRQVPLLDQIHIERGRVRLLVINSVCLECRWVIVHPASYKSVVYKGVSVPHAMLVTHPELTSYGLGM